jgi:hypothetical protein
MSNEQYLVTSYFAVAALSVLFALVTFRCLGRSFTSLIEAAPWRGFSTLLPRVFPAGLLLPSLAGFFSVTYFGCDRSTYEKVISDRAYLVQANQRQISMSLWDLAIAVLLWAFIAVGVITIIRRGDKGLGKH